jgi:acyl-CoA thioesterase I
MERIVRVARLALRDVGRLPVIQGQRMNVLFFGDSICNGQGIAIHKGWVTRLSQSLSELAARFGEALIVTNSSVNGRTTRQALETMPYEVQQRAPEILIVQFGMNDCNIWETDRGNPRVSALAFEANLREIIQRAHSFGAQIIFLNSNHPTGRDQKPCPHSALTYEDQNSQYNAIIRKVAQWTAATILFNDIETAFHQTTGGNRAQLLRYLLPDMLHLSEDGHDLYYDIVHPPIAACIERLLHARRAVA